MRKGFNHLPAVVRAMPGAAGRIVEKAAADIAAGAGATAPIDTGALAASYMFEKTGPEEAIAGSNMEYAPYVEYGTSRGSPAQPHLVPAVDRVQNALGGMGLEFGAKINEAARRG